MIVLRENGAFEGNALQSRRTGTALFAVIPIAILMMSLMVAFVGTTIETSRATVSDMDTFRARAAAQSVAALAISDIWGEFEDLTAGGGAAQMFAFRQHLDGQGITDQSEAQKVQKTSFLDNVALAVDTHGNPTIDGVRIESLEVHRLDNWDSTSIVVEVEAVTSAGTDGSSRERRSSVQEMFTVAPPEWEGLDFALLASNINCLLCHTTIDNVDRAYNQNTGLYGSFDAVQIGSIDAIHFRDDPDSKVAGPILIGRDALLGDGNNVADWSKFNLEGAAPDAFGSIESIVEDTFGNPQFGGLNIFDKDAPDPSANLFLKFLEYDALTDYALPESFPPPYPDNGGIDPTKMVPRPDLAGNRTIDDSEFYASTNGVKGTLSGGSISVLAKGTTVSNETERSKMMSGTDSSISKVTDGNVYLHGTDANPLILDGDVAIDGDVIISGVVKGMGTVRARGNVYVVSDLIYNDGGTLNRTYGKASDGTENNLAIAAGGNIVVGDFYRPAWGEGKVTTGESNGSFNFTMDELAIFNRMEWMKTQPTLPGKTTKQQNGTKTVYYDEKVKETYYVTVPKYKWVKTGKKIKKSKYKWVTKSNGKPAPYTETWKEKVFSHHYYVDEKKKVQDGTKQKKKTKWVKTGNKLSKEEPTYGWVTEQHDNPYYNPYHLPRYYSFSEGSTVPVFNKDGYYDPDTQHWMSEEHAGEWDSSKLTYANPGNLSDPLLYEAGGKPKAVVSTIAPTADWISAGMMRQTIEDQLGAKATGGKELEIDATLYSSNSILGTIPDRKSPNTNGKLLVNGGIVAADVGILAPNGTTVNFDIRGARALSIQSDEGLVISRRFSAPAIKY